MNQDIQEILFTADEIQKKVEELGKQITQDYQGQKPVFVGLLKGSFIFMADLMRHVDLDVELDFVAVSSYGNSTTTTGAVRISKDLSRDIEGRPLIIVEDIVDTGVTLNYMKQYFANRKPSSIKICSMLDKPSRRRVELNADYVGFTVPDLFVVGYGLDYAELYRNLPYIGILKPEIYS